MIRERVKWLLFPGLNLHARLRYRLLPTHFGRAATDGPLDVLDAGCGNGMLAWQSCRRGNRVLGVSIKEGEVQRNRRLFNGYRRIPEDRLSFRVRNLYDLAQLGRDFDEIICSEVLEHLKDDGAVARGFYDVLRPGGVLHLCCPNADHPDNRDHPLDPDERGGHVRPGYTEDSYRALLEPLGFRMSTPIGLGGPVRQWWNRKITTVQERMGLIPGLALFALAVPFLWLGRGEPTVPYSLYVQARKPEDA